MRYLCHDKDYRLMTRFLIITLLFGCSLCATAQTQDRNDTIPIGGSSGLSEAEIQELTTHISGESLNSLTPLHATDIPIHPALEPAPLVAPHININPWPRGSRLPHWATGYMYGYNSQSSSLLYGYTATAGMGVRQQLGRYWIIEGGTSLNKYSVYYNTASFNGALTWQPNRYFSTTVFGSYTTSFMSPMPTMNSFQWGGYITLQTDTDLPFGIDAGARDYYDPMTGHYVAPIVQPFIKIGGSKLGFDFGPMIKDALHKAAGHDSNNGASPIPKPIKVIPQVAPRR